MNWIHHLERRFGHLAIYGLPGIIVALNALVYILFKLRPEYVGFLVFDRELILHGQIWRLFTYVFIPRWGLFLPTQILSVVFYLWSIYSVSANLERVIGAFRFTLYYALGIAGIAMGGLVFGGGGFDGSYGSYLLNGTLLFALATESPDMTFILYVIPARVVWIALIYAAFVLWQFVNSAWDFRLAMLCGLVNYAAFFGPDLVRAMRHRQQVAVRRAKFESNVREGASETMHECCVCHRTEVKAPDLEFRVGRDGQEYCLEHLPKPPPKHMAGD